MKQQEKMEDKFDFIKEKIKDKPINKKRLLIRAGYNLLCAVIFGSTACFVFVWLIPVPIAAPRTARVRERSPQAFAVWKIALCHPFLGSLASVQNYPPGKNLLFSQPLRPEEYHLWEC